MGGNLSTELYLFYIIYILVFVFAPHLSGKGS